MADLLERVDVALRNGHEQVDAALGSARRHEDHEPLDGQVGRQEHAGRPGGEVHLVELEPLPAVHLQIFMSFCFVTNVPKNPQCFSLHEVSIYYPVFLSLPFLYLFNTQYKNK